MGITTKEIAKICGVSRGTVDRALNGKGRISPTTKEKILSVAKEMGYRKDLLARGLVKGKTMFIGVVVFDIRNHYFSQMVNAIELQARANDYFVNISLHEKNQEMEYQLVNSLVDRRVDGILICPVNKGPNFAKFLKRLPIPVVVIGNFVAPELPFVGIDEKQATEDAMSLLLSKGYERIIFVCPPLSDRGMENVYTHEQRALGFIEFSKKYQNLEFIIISTWSYLKELDILLKKKGKKTAVFCSGDIYALQILLHFKKIGIRVPDEIGIMGFDQIDMLEFVTPSLATISNEIEQVGRCAVNMLVDLMNERQTDTHILIPHKVLDGESIR